MIATGLLSLLVFAQQAEAACKKFPVVGTDGVTVLMNNELSFSSANVDVGDEDALETVGISVNVAHDPPTSNCAPLTITGLQARVTEHPENGSGYLFYDLEWVFDLYSQKNGVESLEGFMTLGVTAVAPSGGRYGSRGIDTVIPVNYGEMIYMSVALSDSILWSLLAGFGWMTDTGSSSGGYQGTVQVDITRVTYYDGIHSVTVNTNTTAGDPIYFSTTE